MSASLFPTFRQEVQNYNRSCEHLLSVPVAPLGQPFTTEELQVVNYYVAEMAKMVGQLGKI